MQTDEPPSHVALVKTSFTQSQGHSSSFIGAQERAAEQPLALNAESFGALRSDAANVQPEVVFGEQAKIASSSFVGGLDGKGEIPGTEHPQLTFKSVVAGIVAGGFGSICAIYYGLKTGITPSLNIISSLLGFVFVKGFINLTGSYSVFTVQENAVIQTTAVAVIAVASSTGFSSGLLAMSPNAQAALGDIPGNNPPEGWDGEAFSVDLTWPRTVAFCFAVAFFGFFIAFPLRDYCILQRKLTFPSGTATSAVIATMHANGEEAISNFWVLCKATGISSVTSMFVWAFDGLGDMPMFGIPLANYGFTIDWDLGTFAIGILLSPMINFSILLGGVVGSGILRPYLDEHHKCTAGPPGPDQHPGGRCWYYDGFNGTSSGQSPHYLDGSAYTLFPAIAMVVVDAFYSIVKLSLVVIQGFMETQAEEEDDEEQTDEVRARARKLVEIFRSYKIPLAFHLSGYLVCAAVCVVVVSMVYEVVFWQIIVAICFTPLFAIGIIVGIGMTDWDVSSSFGKLMMLPFGAMNHGGSPIASCAVCMITISGCGAAGNLMQDFKTGYLVGASPKAMFFSQMIGALAGCFIAPTTFALFNSAFTLPATGSLAQTQIVAGKFGIIYRTLACVCTANGISALPENCTLFMLIFGCIALVTNLFVDFLRSRAPRVAAFVPNPMAFSIGLLIGPSPGIEFMVGSTIFEIWRMRDRVKADKLGNIIASGFLAGSVIAVLIQIGMSLGNVQNPMHLTYADNQGHVWG